MGDPPTDPRAPTAPDPAVGAPAFAPSGRALIMGEGYRKMIALLVAVGVVAALPFLAQWSGVSAEVVTQTQRDVLSLFALFATANVGKSWLGKPGPP